MLGIVAGLIARRLYEHNLLLMEESFCGVLCTVFGPLNGTAKSMYLYQHIVVMNFYKITSAVLVIKLSQDCWTGSRRVLMLTLTFLP